MAQVVCRFRNRHQDKETYYRNRQKQAAASGDAESTFGSTDFNLPVRKAEKVKHNKSQPDFLTSLFLSTHKLSRGQKIESHHHHLQSDYNTILLSGTWNISQLTNLPSLNMSK